MTMPKCIQKFQERVALRQQAQQGDQDGMLQTPKRRGRKPKPKVDNGLGTTDTVVSEAPTKRKYTKRKNIELDSLVDAKKLKVPESDINGGEILEKKEKDSVNNTNNMSLHTVFTKIQDLFFN